VNTHTRGFQDSVLQVISRLLVKLAQPLNSLSAARLGSMPSMTSMSTSACSVELGVWCAVHLDVIWQRERDMNCFGERETELYTIIWSRKDR